MANITRFTSPPISVVVEGVDITSADVYVTIKQGTSEFDLTGNQLSMTYADSNTTITFSLTQEQSGSLTENPDASIQVNWITGGVRYATEIVQVDVYENLYDEVIS